YSMISPALRDLAEDLEIQLNEAIGVLKRLKTAAVEERDGATTLLTDSAFAELIALCQDLPALFYAATTVHRDRKEIIRGMVERVLVTRTTETISALIKWADGSEATAIEVPLMRYAHRRIAELAKQGLRNVE